MDNLFLKPIVLSLFGMLPEKKTPPTNANHLLRLLYGLKTIVDGLQRQIVNCIFCFVNRQREINNRIF
jgi:hypothetical protein